MAKKPKLTEKQKLFAEYVVLEGKSLIEAYELAGYSMEGQRSTARRNAFALYKSATVQAYIKELSEMALRGKDDIFTKLLLFYIDIVDNEEVPMKERLKASEYLAKLYSLLNENVNVGASEDMNIQFNITTTKKEDDAE